MRHSPSLLVEGDYSWLDLDWEGFRKSLLGGPGPVPAIYLSRLARHQFLIDDLKGASAYASAALREISPLLGPESEEALFCEETLALCGIRTWGWTRANGAAEGLVRKTDSALGPESPQARRALACWVSLACWSGDRNLSRRLLSELFRRDLAVHGPLHRFPLADRLDLAAEVALAGEIGEALKLARDCVRDTEAVLGPDNPLHLFSQARLGELLNASGKAREAAALLGKTACLFESSLGRGHLRTLECMRALSAALWTAGERKLAAGIMSEAAHGLAGALGMGSHEAEKAFAEYDFMLDEIRIARAARRAGEDKRADRGKRGRSGPGGKGLPGAMNGKADRDGRGGDGRGGEEVDGGNGRR
jgi:hypothetical protein